MEIKHIKESTHWYCAITGEPKYTVIAKTTGKERPTTLADARKLNLVPSVTTILAQLAKPALTNYLNENLLLAALTLPRIDGESELDWINRVMTDSKAHSNRRREEGEQAHAIIQAYYESTYMPFKPPYVDAVDKALRDAFGEQEWLSEHSFAHPDLRFGGKVDLHSKSGVVVDIKTSEKDPETIKPYPEHLYQLSAYREGLKLGSEARCANIYVNALTNQVKVVEHSKEALAEGWECFTHLLRFFQIKNHL
jgi:hypothetical protein